MAKLSAKGRVVIENVSLGDGGRLVLSVKNTTKKVQYELLRKYHSQGGYTILKTFSSLGLAQETFRKLQDAFSC